MKLPGRFVTVVLAVVAGSLLLVACGNGEEETPATPTATPTAAATPETPTGATEPATATPGRFAIYLPAEGFRLEEMADLSKIQLMEDPILSVDDILAYSSATHEIRLRSSAAERLAQLGLPGKPFVVAVGREAVYAGEFMGAWMSRSSQAVVILWPPMGSDGDTIRIQLGYPGPDFFIGEDPRSDSRILESLEQASLLD
jgi:hypothetical protein